MGMHTRRWSRVQSLRAPEGVYKVVLMVFENVEMNGIYIRVLKGAISKAGSK
jgi:hypothetical protein